MHTCIDRGQKAGAFFQCFMMDVGEREQGVDGNERDIERPAQTLSQAAGNAQSSKGAGAGSEGNSLKSFTAAACSSQTAADHSENDFRVFLSGLGLKVSLTIETGDSDGTQISGRLKTK